MAAEIGVGPSCCTCKSSCKTKRKQGSTRGCPCKGNNILCSEECQCGTTSKPCMNKDGSGRGETVMRPRGPRQGQGFMLSSANNSSEEKQRVEENNDVKNFIDTLDSEMVRKLAIRALRRGVGSMDYIHILLIMDDDLCEVYDGDASNMELERPDNTEAGALAPDPSGNNPVVEWCICGHCRPMPQDIENKCCRQKTCITNSNRFSKLCLDPDVLELSIRNSSDIRNDREDNSTRSFRKAAYRQFILARHGHLGKGNRRVCPSCVVLRIRAQFPSLTGVYMGYREH